MPDRFRRLFVRIPWKGRASGLSFFRPRLFLLAGLIAVLTLTAAVYRPGLAGPFLFDDYANLPALGANGPIVGWPAFQRYITSGNADPTGRPVALVSFLIDAHDWPADPAPFKRTNVLLHLLNGILLFVLLGHLGTMAGERKWSMRHAWTAALIASAFWLLHPLFVSTTLYIVQREAMLPATFVFAGLIGWLQGRYLLSRGEVRQGCVVAIGSLFLCTLLAVLSKANGILLPAFVLVIEYGLLARAHPVAQTDGARMHRLALALCGLASGVIAAGLLYLGVKGIVLGIGDVRPWTLDQRLLTEPRVLWDYLRLLWLPRPFTPGVFNDQVVPSRSLIQPWTTLPAAVGIAALIAGAVSLRSRWPTATVAILFFVVGHVVEATTIPLELYFEHRNYLPAALMFWPLALWLSRPAQGGRSSKNAFGLRIALGLLILAGLGSMTYANAKLWGNNRDQAALWAVINPESPRAQVNAAQVDLARGHPERAVTRLAPLLEKRPDEVQLALNMVAARCATRTLDAADLQRARTALHDARDPGTLLASWFGRVIASQKDAMCPGLGLSELSALADSAAGNPRFSKGRLQDIRHVQGLIALERHNPAGALSLFDSALALEPRLDFALEQAALLGSAGYAAQGLRHLATFDTMPPSAAPQPGMPMLHAWVLNRQQYWPRERARLENTLRNDLEKAGRHP